MTEIVVLTRKTRFRQIDEQGLLYGDYIDVPAGTEVEVVKCELGLYLVTHNGFYTRLWPSDVNTVCPGVVCKCPTTWCPRHGRIKRK